MDQNDFTTKMTRADAQRLRSRTGGHRPRSMLRPMARVGRGTDLTGHDNDDMFEPHDKIEVFQNVIAVIRWGVVGLTFILATPQVAEAPDLRVSVIGVALLVLTVGRHVRPIRFDNEHSGDLALLIEVTLTVVAVAITDLWASPFAVSLTIPIVVAGFAHGHIYAARVAGIAALVPTTLVFWQQGLALDVIQQVSQWCLILVVVGLIAGQTRRISGEADRQHTIAMNRMECLTDANSLLDSLHRVAQTLPASLDLNEVLDTTMGRLRGLFDYDAVALLVFDETDASWHVMRSEGTNVPIRLGPTMLPNPLKTAIAQNRLVDIPDLGAADTLGLSNGAQSGLYTTLTARGQIIGLLALEHHLPNHYSERTVQMFNGFVDPVALAVDNARWFGRLRTMGADEERTRIARDLHDRIGQSMAFLAFELDRVIKSHDQEQNVGPALEQLRDDVRAVIREIRDTLSDLRTDVSDSRGFEQTVEEFAGRLSDRSGLSIGLHLDSSERLPIRQERELWRIAQEAMVNVERHAEATTVTINWTSDGRTGVLEITDDGRGFTLGDSGRSDSYGLVGMRERASSVGATMEVDSEPGAGTTIRCLISTSDSENALAA
ncbi:MAG: GAF domain-containing sensor histidine kinase [Acidimicrobiales bacterium]